MQPNTFTLTKRDRKKTRKTIGQDTTNTCECNVRSVQLNFSKKPFQASVPKSKTYCRKYDDITELLLIEIPKKHRHYFLNLIVFHGCGFFWSGFSSERNLQQKKRRKLAKSPIKHFHKFRAIKIRRTTFLNYKEIRFSPNFEALNS